MLSSCRNDLALAPRRDGDRCIEGSVAAYGSIPRTIKYSSRPSVMRGRRDRRMREVNAGDASENWKCGVKGGGVPLPLDVLAVSEG